MLLKYDCEINNAAIAENLKRLLNQIYKLLPSREEGNDWNKPLETIVEELSGMSRLFTDHHKILFSLISKLEGLFLLTKEDDFALYRRVIFDSLGLVGELIKICQNTN